MKIVKGSIKGGGRGVAIGRNVFQFKNPTAIARVIVEVVHKGKDLEDVMESVLSFNS